MSLYTKVLLGVALAALFAGEGVVVYSRKAVHSALLSQIREHGEQEAEAVTRALAPTMTEADEKRLLPILTGYLRVSGGAYAAALDNAGRVVAHSNVAEVGEVYGDSETGAALRSERSRSFEKAIGGRPMLVMTFPVFGETERDPDEEFLLSGSDGGLKGPRVGLLLVGLPLDAAVETERRIGAGIHRLVLVLGGVSALLLFFFLRRLLAPIALLATATSKIRGGDYGGSVPVTTGDEIGELARSFNEMSLELGRATVSKGFFNDILDSIRDCVVVTDAAGAIVLVNPAAIELLGWPKESLLGRPGADLLDGDEASFTTAAKNAAARFKTKSGEKVSILFSSSAIKAADGRITGYIGAAKDVSDLRKLEARMHQSEKLSAVGQLAAGVAHEINNPLGVILGFAQGLARQLAPEDELELPIKSIEREALRCKALVQNLLTFARTSQVERAPTDVNEAVEQSLALIRTQAKLSRVVLSTEIAKDLPPVLGNKNQLEQVIMNLAKNAIDAMPNGGNLTLSTELLERPPHSWILLRFVDDGTGIPAAALPRIFDPFFTTKPIGQGTGLGLSLVSEIVQKHSGEISVESRPGRTEFTVKLPVRTGQELERELAQRRREKSAERALDPAAKGSISHG
ncbi:MAG: HAMP domain-containing protein [Elusimicrobia bacterium]|nr:HAMP domain-containing protein [Elusimicrobiota bacterium]